MSGEHRAESEVGSGLGSQKLIVKTKDQKQVRTEQVTGAGELPARQGPRRRLHCALASRMCGRLNHRGGNTHG